jgi:hypothetical protein
VYELEANGAWLEIASATNLRAAVSEEAAAESEWLVPLGDLGEFRVRLEVRCDGTFRALQNGVLMPSTRLTMEAGVIRSSSSAPVEWVLLSQPIEDRGSWEEDGNTLVLHGSRERMILPRVGADGLVWEALEGLGDLVLVRTRAQAGADSAGAER